MSHTDAGGGHHDNQTIIQETQASGWLPPVIRTVVDTMKLVPTGIVGGAIGGGLLGGAFGLAAYTTIPGAPVNVISQFATAGFDGVLGAELGAVLGLGLSDAKRGASALFGTLGSTGRSLASGVVRVFTLNRRNLSGPITTTEHQTGKAAVILATVGALSGGYSFVHYGNPFTRPFIDFGRWVGVDKAVDAISRQFGALGPSLPAGVQFSRATALTRNAPAPQQAVLSSIGNHSPFAIQAYSAGLAPVVVRANIQGVQHRAAFAQNAAA